jgi:hypothetical protein
MKLKRTLLTEIDEGGYPRIEKAGQVRCIFIRMIMFGRMTLSADIGMMKWRS